MSDLLSNPAHSEGGRAGGTDRRPADGAPAARTAGGGMGDAVTPHALITNRGDWRPLIQGIDTLDLGLYVDWQGRLVDVQPQWEYQRERAVKGETAIWRCNTSGQSLVRPSSKRNYRYHLQWPDLNLWIANLDAPKQFPNLYASPTAKSLWLNGSTAVVESITQLIEELGGAVLQVQVSRCDLAADFWMEEALTLDFLRSHLVSKTTAIRPWEEDGKLETFYVGKGGAPIQGRIYNKMLAVARNPASAFFLALWGGPIESVWRVEFQLKRQVLRAFGINSLDDLLDNSGGLWSYLTGKWMSLRLHDDVNTSRRTVHPWWQAVHDLADTFGPACDLKRDLGDIPKVPADWYVAHIAGCIAPFAARRGKAKLDDALEDVMAQVREKVGMKSWDDEYARQRIRLNQQVEGEDDCDAPF